MSRTRRATAAVALLPLAVLAGCGGTGASPSSSPTPAASSPGQVTISETGSTLLLPLISSWQVEYGARHPQVLVTTSGTGSGAGITDAAAGTVDIGGSDAYLSPAERSQFPGLENIPVAVAALTVNYHLPGVRKPLNLDGDVLARIYTGRIVTWNDPAIAALNKGVRLPSIKIVTLHRADSSGSTFLITSYMNDQAPGVWPSSNVGTTVNWPHLPGATAENGSGTMVDGCGAIKGCIAYIGVSYRKEIATAGLGTASIANGAGKFEQATTTTIAEALTAFARSTPASGSQSLINGKAGYPIINYEYTVVRTDQPDAAGASAIKRFLTWGITAGSGPKFLAPVNFVALPPRVVAIARTLIGKIH